MSHFRNVRSRLDSDVIVIFRDAQFRDPRSIIPLYLSDSEFSLYLLEDFVGWGEWDATETIKTSSSLKGAANARADGSDRVTGSGMRGIFRTIGMFHSRRTHSIYCYYGHTNQREHSLGGNYEWVERENSI
jgi:hypothetical protein